MTKKDIYDREETNLSLVTLYHEGTFWIAYERSAYILCSQVRQFKASKKVIKSAGGIEIVSVGFPVAKESGNLAGLSPVSSSGECLVYGARYPIRPEDFNIWKSSIAVSTPRARGKVKLKSQPLYTNLPVYEESYRLLQLLYTQLCKVPKDIKYTLLEQVKKDALELSLSVYRANVTFDKGPVLSEARALMERIKIQVRLLCDLHCMSINLYCELSESEESISKHLAAWHRHVSENDETNRYDESSNEAPAHERDRRPEFQ